MRSTTLLASSAALLLSLANARIVGFNTPRTIAPDSTVKLEIVAENDIAAAQDVAFSFGLAPVANYHAGTLYSLLSSKFLGPDLSNVIQNITHYVHIPARTTEGQYVLGGAHFSLLGTSVSPILINYAANVTVGNLTSSEYVFSSRIQS